MLYLLLQLGYISENNR